MTKVARSADAYLAIGSIGFACFLSIMPALAEDACTKPLQMVSSLPMKPLGSTDLFTIPVSLTGIEKQFLFDTGGFFTQISPEVVDELKLRPRHSDIEIYAADGSVSRSIVTVPSFAVGKIHGDNFEIPVSPDKGLAGIFSPVAFKNFDFDLDFSAQKVNIILADHCDGRVIYWPAKAIAAVPIVVRDLHITVPVTVDGHQLSAIIDTGASTSTMRLDIAKFAFGLTPDSADMKVVGHLNGDEKALIYEHPFHTLAFEGVTVTNPKIEILTDVVNKNADHSFETGTRIKKISDDLTLPEIIVGMDVLRRLHVYIALKEGRLYLTEASSPPPQPAGTPQPSAPPQ